MTRAKFRISDYFLRIKWMARLWYYQVASVLQKYQPIACVDTIERPKQLDKTKFKHDKIIGDTKFGFFYDTIY